LLWMKKKEEEKLLRGGEQGEENPFPCDLREESPRCQKGVAWG